MWSNCWAVREITFYKDWCRCRTGQGHSELNVGQVHVNLLGSSANYTNTAERF